MKKAVIFGPFIGEFGWELLFWQGWVRNLCKNEFADYYKIAISFNGRQPFYPYVDSFISIPEDLHKEIGSSRNYICDGWRDGYPGQALEYKLNVRKAITNILKGKKVTRSVIERKWPGPSIEPRIRHFLDEQLGLIKDFQEIRVFAPWETISWNNKTFGWIEPESLHEFGLGSNARRIDFSHQLLEKIDVSINCPKLPDEITKHPIFKKDKLIALFPRKRDFRRADKNWEINKYVELILELKKLNYNIVLLGDLQGAYFVGDKFDNDVLDLINIPDSYRLSAHIYALKRCELSVGAMSGATLMSLANGTPTLIFGYGEEEYRYHQENYTNTPLFYFSKMNPEVAELIELINKFKNYLSFCQRI